MAILSEQSELSTEFKIIRALFPEINGEYAPDIFPLGYFVRRSEPRLQYVMPITMVYDNDIYDVKSKNISANGLQIFMPKTRIQREKVVQLTFEKFKKERDKIVGGIDDNVPLENLNYVIKKVQHTEEKTYVSLVQQDITQETKDYISRFIDGSRIRYKVDASDRMNASKAQYFEKLYAINMHHIPMFLNHSEDNGYYLNTVVRTEKNASLFDYFNRFSKHPDFSAFALPARMEKLVELSHENTSTLVFTYWENHQLHTVFDFEFHSPSDLGHIILKVGSRKGRIFKVQTSLNKKPAQEKINGMIKKIETIDPAASKLIDQRASEAIAQLIITDITRFVSSQKLFINGIKPLVKEKTDLSILCQHKLIKITTGEVVESYADDVFVQPDIVNINVTKQRFDPRYHYEMDVEVFFEGKVYPGRTIDFSRTGLGLTVLAEVDIPKEANIKITFSGLMSKKGFSTPLGDVPHKVMVSKAKEGGLFIGVNREKDRCNPKVNSYFTNLVEHNKSKLDEDIKDQIDTISSAFYEAFVTENIQTIPVVIKRDREEHHYVREIGLTDMPCNLAEKLYVDEVGYDFTFLTSIERSEEIHTRAIRNDLKNPQGFMLFVYKGLDENGQESLFSVTEMEIERPELIEQIVKIVLKNNGACIRVEFLNNLAIDTIFKKQTIEKVQQLNKASAKLLSQDYKEMIGFAELIDVTDEYQKCMQACNLI